MRKEQGLLLATVLLAVFYLLTGGGEGRRTIPPRSKTLPLPPLTEGGSSLVDAGRVAYPAKDRNLFLRPSDTSPLPPLDLPALEIPVFPGLPLVTPPLERGFDTQRWYLGRIQGNQAAPPSKAPPSPPVPGGENPPGAGQEGQAPGQGAPGTGVPPTAGEGQEDPSWRLTWDSLHYKDPKKPKVWGRLESPDPHQLGQLHPGDRLAVTGPFQRDLVFRKFHPDTGKEMYLWTLKPEEVIQIDRIVFADTIQNRIAMWERRIPPGDTGLPQRERFIFHLLRNEREHLEAFEAAERHARIYIDAAAKSPRGHELLCIVYASTGQLDAELRKYQSLMQGEFRNEPFIYRGLGVLEHRLGLTEWAEKHLRQAIQLKSSLAENQLAESLLALSRFYDSEGRSREALEAVRRAARLVNPGMKEELAFSIRALEARCCLSVGDLEAASTALAQAATLTGSQGEDHPGYRLLRASLLAAGGRHREALEAFEGLRGDFSASVEPALGAGVSAFLLGEVDRALELLEEGLSRDPIEKYRLLAAQAFVHWARGETELSKVQDARRIAPKDPYVLYVLGSILARERVWEEGGKTLEENLEGHPELVEVMAELAHMLLSQAQELGSTLEAVGLLEKAERYARKAVEMEAGRSKLWAYADLLGVIRFHLRQNEGAREAFTKSLEWAGKEAGTHAKIYLSLLDYRQGRTDDAVRDLGRLRTHLTEGDPHKAYLTKVIEDIRDHTGKRLFQDPFQTLRKHWVCPRRTPSFLVRDGRLILRGKTAGKEHRARFEVSDATRFLEAGIEMELSEEFEGQRAFFRISDERPGPRGGQPVSTFDFLIGWEEGLRVVAHEGRDRSKPLLDLRAHQIPSASLERGAKVRLEILLIRPRRGRADRPVLVFLVDGREIARSQIKTLSLSRKKSLFIDLLVEGDRGARVDIAFDEFRMVTKEQ